ncbi:MAG: ATP-binding protein [Marinomonas sp.]
MRFGDGFVLRGRGISLVISIGTGAVFGLLAMLCIAATRFDEPIATIWIPNAVIAAFLLHSGHDRANPLCFAAIFIGSACANWFYDFPAIHALGFAAANMIEIFLAVYAGRYLCSGRPNFENVSHLARFVLAGGLIAPAVSSTIAMFAISMDGTLALDSWISWFLSDAIGMIIAVPLILLTIDAVKQGRSISRDAWAERALLLIAGSAATLLVFSQDTYPLMFLITPIVLIHSFRCGTLGSAIFVTIASCIAALMSWNGYGPASAAAPSVEAKLLILQCFMAANFLVGVPAAAILASREKLTQALAAQEQDLALLADNISDAVFRYDLDGICTYVSPSAHETLGANPQDFLGERASSRMHPEAREAIVAAERKLLSGESERERFTYRRYVDDDAGRAVYLEADCKLVRNSETGAPEAIVVAARNVTERIELEHALRAARQESEQATRAKSEFLANMSHEIRTPMNGVLGFAELMLHNDLDPEQRRQVELIVQSGRSMMMLLNDILDLSKIEAGQIEIDRQPILVEHMLKNCVQLHRGTAERKGIELKVEPFESRVQVFSDGQRLRQIVLNLVSNAVKFTDKGSVSIRCTLDGDLVRIAIRDTGVGIDEDRLARVFRPFSQADHTTARRFGGTGLGLSISRELAELLDGYIEVESEVGTGSCFTLTLPFIEVAEPMEEPPEISEELVDINQPGLLPPACHILLVEDHDINRLLVRTMLERCGQRVSTASNGHEAIAKVLEAQLHGELFDLVLMDIQMPDCDGYQATRTIREEGIRSETLPIIALSANAFPEDVAASKKAGMQAHIPKPLVFSDLVAALQRWLPVRIVADLDDVPSLDEAPSPPIDPEVDEARQRLEEDFGKALTAPHHVPSPALQVQWQQRRSEALEAIEIALRDGQLTGALGDDLASLVHKLAGTAGMFGEESLGEKAAAFERALRSGVGHDVREQLARELLEAA